MLDGGWVEVNSMTSKQAKERNFYRFLSTSPVDIVPNRP